MCSMKVLSLIGAALGASVVAAQTPMNTDPSTVDPLTVSYGGQKVIPGMLLPKLAVSTIPTFNHMSSSNATYSLLLVDLSISTASVNVSALKQDDQVPLAPGIASGRTTRLHFWQPGLMFAADASLVNTTAPIAYYAGPMPPAGDIPHTYTFYLFPTTGNVTPPTTSPFNMQNVNQGTNRMSFNVQNFAKQEGVGPLAAANYFLVQNTSNATTSSPSTGRSSSSPSATSKAFTGKASGIVPGALACLVISISAMLFAVMA